jgi:hypothetical protein
VWVEENPHGIHIYIQGVIESCTDILTTNYWLHVELGKKLKNSMSKNKMTFIF